MSSAALICTALLLEAALGWPGWLYNHVRHPVVWIGSLISWLDAKLNLDSSSALFRKMMGIATLSCVVSLTLIVAVSVSRLLPNTLPGLFVEALLASSLLASRSLYQHVDAVVTPLSQHDLSAARVAVSHIVGRDPNELDGPAIARASLESLAENASDGVVAPLFWGALFGLPGIAAYKAINTLDSMIGHLNPRYCEFGWASARIDDLVNFIPARLTAAAFVAAGHSMSALKVAIRDARLHRSPNAGWPESALAGAIGVRLSGPRSYGGQATQEPWVNGECPDPDSVSIQRGLRLYVVAMFLIWVSVAAFATIVYGYSLSH